MTGERALRKYKNRGNIWTVDRNDAELDLRDAGI
jgi:hypothetical protein